MDIDFQNTQGIIFVVDSNDRDRVSEARDELQRMLNEDELRDALLLVFANKQDLPNAMNAAEITDKLGLHSLRNRHWYIQTTCATSGKSLYDSIKSSGSAVLINLFLFLSLHQVMVCTKVWSGSRTTSKREVKCPCFSPISLFFSLSFCMNEILPLLLLSLSLF